MTRDPFSSQRAESSGRPHRRDRRERALAVMALDEPTYIDVGESVAVRHAERLVTDVFARFA